MSSIRYLKIKIKSLASEIQHIHKEEHKTKATYRYFKGRQGHEKTYEKEVDTFWELRKHRSGLSYDSRDAQLAYAFIRGKRYREVENNAEPIIRFYWSYAAKANLPIFAMNLQNIARLASKYGNMDVIDADIEKWILAEEFVEQAVAAE